MVSHGCNEAAALSERTGQAHDVYRASGVLRQRADLNTYWKQLVCMALDAAKVHDVLLGAMTKAST